MGTSKAVSKMGFIAFECCPMGCYNMPKTLISTNGPLGPTVPAKLVASPIVLYRRSGDCRITEMRLNT